MLKEVVCLPSTWKCTENKFFSGMRLVFQAAWKIGFYSVKEYGDIFNACYMPRDNLVFKNRSNSTS